MSTGKRKLSNKSLRLLPPLEKSVIPGFFQDQEVLINDLSLLNELDRKLDLSYEYINRTNAEGNDEDESENVNRLDLTPLERLIETRHLFFIALQFYYINMESENGNKKIGINEISKLFGGLPLDRLNKFINNKGETWEFTDDEIEFLQMIYEEDAEYEYGDDDPNGSGVVMKDFIELCLERFRMPDYITTIFKRRIRIAERKNEDLKSSLLNAALQYGIEKEKLKGKESYEEYLNGGDDDDNENILIGLGIGLENVPSKIIIKLSNDFRNQIIHELKITKAFRITKVEAKKIGRRMGLRVAANGRVINMIWGDSPFFGGDTNGGFKKYFFAR
ncbi:uncharacterized protein NDAI_0F02180 [Naumovozyma dairenensis CBS 421]|uniref:Uncharacterized protein n=1 Tax=Naumovozyma dairenensis (strain ATCC 10597 / BCRC 20456 / CBS 421 / NBRC 0211 / NRRL Y-12639) TaxID=1071378 RepID=G0WCM5_NAUDC|nr:hypothetical protein NDAI_0F02180 [Naumovozyma dairenensis CBS 421]CCD25536.1 hypothetical protein NDAI_0F02180 [Naumovozyma dairenensis CBS 421]